MHLKLSFQTYTLIELFSLLWMMKIFNLKFSDGKIASCIDVKYLFRLVSKRFTFLRQYDWIMEKQRFNNQFDNLISGKSVGGTGVGLGRSSESSDSRGSFSFFVNNSISYSSSDKQLSIYPPVYSSMNWKVLIHVTIRKQ